MPKVDLAAMAAELDSELRAIRELVRRPLELEFAKGQLTGPQQSAMAAILSAGGLSLKELSVQLGLAHSTTSGIVDRLEKKDLVARRVDDSDRRSSKIEATAAVIKFVVETMPRISIHPLVEALRRATPEERAAISTGLKTLRAALSTRE